MKKAKARYEDSSVAGFPVPPVRSAKYLLIAEYLMVMQAFPAPKRAVKHLY